MLYFNSVFQIFCIQLLVLKPFIISHSFGPLAVFVLSIPLFSVFFCLTVRLNGQNFIKIFSVIFLGLSSLISFILFYSLWIFQGNYYITIFTWVDSGLLLINWGFMFDTLTLSMFCVVTTVSFFVHWYSCSYM